MELLGLNVGVKQVEPVIKSVLCNIASMDIDTIPSPSTLVSMLAEMKGLACQQLSEILTQENNLTLHSDGTSKFGVHYVGSKCPLKSVHIQWVIGRRDQNPRGSAS